MNNIIIVKEHCDNALSIDNGEIIKEKIAGLLKENENIILDFNGISLFATPFFNACIGYFIIKLSPTEFDKKVSCINLSALGEETFRYSYENAIIVYKRNVSENEQKNINEIIESNIKNS